MASAVRAPSLGTAAIDCGTFSFKDKDTCEFPDRPHLRIQIRVGVAHGYDYGGVPKQLFHRNDIHSPVQEARRKGVAQRVPRHASDNVTRLDRRLVLGLWQVLVSEDHHAGK